MEKFLDSFVSGVEKVNGAVNGFVWGPVMLVVFLLVGLLCTVRSGVFQVTKFKLWMEETILAIFKKKSVRKTDDKKAISQFQALSTALAATVGTGNIAGVATAIVSGGPGAIFWMWLSAFLGMMTNFSENVLGIKYRYKNEKGNWVGGAMIYMDRGLNMKWLAVIFSFFCVLASFGIGNMSQANSIASAVHGTFGIPKWIVGVVIMAFVALVIMGGIKRIAQVTEKIVPFMAVFYIIGGLAIIICNIQHVPAAFGMIFRGAFNIKAAGGGFLGYTVAQAVRYGIARGVFSNEAGLGSSVMVHSASDVKEPVVQGMWGIFEVFADTIIICTITALSILTTVYSADLGAPVDAAGNVLLDSAGNVLSGAGLTTAAFNSTFGSLGGVFISVSLTLFAFSTILGWSYYGERGIEYIFGLKAVPVYKVVFILVIILGCVGSLDLVWDISDTFNGLMAIPNLFAVILLHGQVMDEIKSYMKRRKEGKLNQ
ncbi:MAG: alanine/glycine:cation symporter family protein [Clostridia bacterium]